MKTSGYFTSILIWFLIPLGVSRAPRSGVTTRGRGRSEANIPHAADIYAHVGRNRNNTTGTKIGHSSNTSKYSTSCFDYLPTFSEIIWRENYPRGADVSAQIGKSQYWNPGFRQIEKYSSSKPYNFNVAIISGDMTFPSEIPPYQWTSLVQAKIKVIFAWNLNYTYVDEYFNHLLLSNTTGGHATITSSSSSSAAHHRLLRNSNNFIGARPLVQGIPLGLDLHTLRDRRTDYGKKWWGERKQSSEQQ
jgi:hypothetical protein